MEQATPKQIKEPPVLFDKTQNLISRIQKHLDGPLITYWNSPRGAVCSNDVIGFYEIFQHIGKNNRVYLFIKSDGGSGNASLRIVNLIRQYCSKVVTLVPLVCASAATMISLGSDEIQMGPMAYLSAVDTSLTHDLSPTDRDNDRVSVSLDELNRIISLWHREKTNKDLNPYNTLFQYIHPLVIGAVDRAESLSIMLCNELLSYHMKDRKKIIAISNILNSKYPSHNYPILFNEAKKIGLNVSKMSIDINDLLLDLNELYSEMGQKASTDFDETNSHSNEIINILEANNTQIIYKLDKDWFYRKDERRWITLNDNSCWHKISNINNEIITEKLHIM